MYILSTNTYTKIKICSYFSIFLLHNSKMNTNWQKYNQNVSLLLVQKNTRILESKPFNKEELKKCLRSLSSVPSFFMKFRILPKGGALVSSTETESGREDKATFLGTGKLFITTGKSKKVQLERVGQVVFKHFLPARSPVSQRLSFLACEIQIKSLIIKSESNTPFQCSRKGIQHSDK